VENEELRSEARAYYGEGSAHGWEHALRVERLAARIADDEPEADERVVRFGAILHDIGRRKEAEGEIDDHAAWGAEESRRLLRAHGYDDATADCVAHCVEAHRYSTGPEPGTLEARVVADADDLDALGAVGVARTFAHGGSFDATVEHIHGKLLRLRDRMRTPAGRRLGEDRHRFIAEFAERFEEERDADEPYDT